MDKQSKKALKKQRKGQKKVVRPGNHEKVGKGGKDQSGRKLQRDSATTGPSENASSLVPGKGTEGANL